jgi:MinD-like ATPase involved in chromosome partitioning or flagellar assembly
MSKTIAVWGSPDSGKTTFSVKLANAIYENYQCTVIVLFCCLETPALPVIFPNYRPEDIFSVGTPLSKPEVSLDEVVKSVVTVKKKVNYGFLGYRDGENRFSYPLFDETKAKQLMKVLGELADIVIIDCDSNLTGSILSETAVCEADEIIRLASPDLKSISWYLSQKAVCSEEKYRWDKHIQGLNTPNADVFVPVEDVKTHLKDVAFILPFSRAVKEQTQKGILYETAADRRFNKKMKAVAKRIVEDDGN